MNFHHICISVSNLETSILFYESLFWFIENKRFIGDWVVIIFWTLLWNLRFEILCFQSCNHVNVVPVFWEELKNQWLKHVAFSCSNVEFDAIYKKCVWESLIYEDIKIRNLVQKNFYIKDPDWIVLEFLVE